MFRLVPFAVSALALLSAVPSLAADYMEDFRPAFVDEGVSDSPLGFEFGVGYWYSQGTQTFTIGGDSTFESTDTSQFGEAFLRIDDYSTSSYLKADVGYAYSIVGTSAQPYGDEEIIDGTVVHAGADFGYNPFNTAINGQGITPIVGYRYWNDSPNIGRSNFTTATSSDDVTWNLGDPTPVLGLAGEKNNVDVHALRLGVAGKIDMGDYIDFTGEVAAVPYAWINGTFGAYGSDVVSIPGQRFVIQSSPTAITGTGYGAMGEVTVGLHPMDNMTLRLGGRAWYVQGTVDTTFSRAVITGPIDSDGDGETDIDPVFVNSNAIIESNPFSLFRYGAIAKLSVSF